MKRLHTFHLWEQPQAAMYRDLLAQEGIACLLRNEQLGAALGEIPFTECYPELWVIDDETWPRASLLLKGWLEVRPNAAAWTCTRCGEVSEAQFSVCWNCGSGTHD